MFRPRLSTGLAQRVAALSLIAAAVAVPATTAAASTCNPFDYFCTVQTPIMAPQPVAQQLMVNSSFEDNTPQTTPPQPGWIKSENAAFVLNPHHYGAQSLEVDLGIFGALPAGPPQAFAFQDVAIPATAAHPLLRFYLDVQTSLTGTTATDTLRVTAALPPAPTNSFPPIVQIPTLLGTYSNLNNTHGGWCRKGDFDLSAYRGQTVRITFSSLINSAGSFNATGSTRFFVDDAELWTDAPLVILGPAC